MTSGIPPIDLVKQHIINVGKIIDQTRKEVEAIAQSVTQNPPVTQTESSKE